MTGDAKYTDLRGPTRPAVYLPFRQDLPGQVNAGVRTVGEPLAIGGSAATLIVVGMLAGLLPARRASRVNPIVALQAE